MGLLDTWQEWKNETGMFKNSSSNIEEIQKNSQYGDQNRYGSLSTAGGVQPSYTDKKPQLPNSRQAALQVGRQNVDQVLQQKGLTRSQLMQDPSKAGALIAQANKNQQGTPTGAMPDNLGEKGFNAADLQKDPGFMDKFAKLAGVNLKEASANWKEKGGFEGLMSNPAFSLGLALMQSSANGKTINKGILDNFVKAGNISKEYKDRIEARKLEPIQATSGDIAEVKDMLKTINIEEGNWLENLISGKAAGAKYEAAVEEIAVEFQKEIREKQNALKEQGKSQVIKRTDQFKILERLVNSNKIKKKENFLNRIGITSGTLQMDIPGLAQGGPVQQGKPYVVGEQGPEIIIPRSDGDVLTNDDSQIYAMLLASNPQLQKVSKARAEKIMRNRFPEYFEG